jgi:hypothetical protein
MSQSEVKYVYEKNGGFGGKKGFGFEGYVLMG